MQISYAGKISKDDFLKSILLNSPELKFQRWLFGIILIFFTFSIVYLMLKNSPELPLIFELIFPYGLILLIFMTFPWWIPYLQLSSYDQKGNIYRNNVFGVIDDIGISINNSEIKANFQWSVYIDHKISKDLLLLYQGKNNFNIFKQSMFSSQDEWEKFISFATEKVSINKKRA